MSTIKNQYWNFLFFQKHKKWSSFLNFGWMWLVNELVLTFYAPIKCAQAQFNLIILSRVMPHTTYYRQTDRHTDRHFRKNRFFWLKLHTRKINFFFPSCTIYYFDEKLLINEDFTTQVPKRLLFCDEHNKSGTAHLKLKNQKYSLSIIIINRTYIGPWY